MATQQPLPRVNTQQGSPSPASQGSQGSHDTIMIDIQKIQLDVLTDMRGIMKAIAVNLMRFYSAFQKSQGVYVNVLNSISEMNKDFIENSRKDTADKLAEAEKQREGKLVDDAAKPASLLDTLKKVFEEYFGIFRMVFNILRLVLVPLVIGFIAGFREKFDLLTVFLAVAILYPIRTFKFMIRVFGFLFEALKSIGKLISKIGPAFQGAVQGITNFFRRMRIFFLRTLDLGKILQPIRALFSGGAGIFQGLAKVLGGIFRVFSKLFIPLTIIMAVYDGIMGAIEGYKEGGIMGAIKGALVGILDGLIGWLVGIGQWIVSNLLELFGFDELAKAVDEFNFKEFLKKYISFLNPFTLLLSVFDENSPIRKQFSAALDKLGNVGDFISDIWDSITETIKNILIKIGKAIPGGKALLNALGLKGEDEKAQGRSAAPLMAMDEETRKEYDAIDTGNEQVDNLARAALETGDRELYEELTGSGRGATGLFDTSEDTESAKKLMMERGYTAEQVERLAQTGYMGSRSQVPVPVPSPNKAELIDEKTKEADKAKQPEAPKPAQTNNTILNAPNNAKTAISMNQAPHADRVGLGSRGNAGYSGFNKVYT
jgi:hypothetical protein